VAKSKIDQVSAGATAMIGAAISASDVVEMMS